MPTIRIIVTLSVKNDVRKLVNIKNIIAFQFCKNKNPNIVVIAKTKTT